ncbi:MAG: flagellar hook-basal body complex protein, partial [Christensenellales bacterium]
DGFFIISDGAGYTYTRAGNFKTDSENYLVDSNGNYVMGYTGTPGADGTVTTLEKIKLDPKYTDISVNRNGEVVGIDSTTKATTVIGKVALASFANPNGLEKTGGNSYRETVNSGNPVYKAPGTGGTGSINPSSLEMSNVDLTSEFTDMIVTQRGFQANSRIITTTDEMLEELVNMVR